MKGMIRYFAGRPLIANVVLFGVILLAVSLWDQVGKEERPEFAMNFVRVNIPYPGAPAEDVELFVIKPVEEQLKGISGLYEISSSAAFGRASLRVTVDPNVDAFLEKVQEIKDAVERADLPSEVEDPVFDRYSSSEKAIMDIALYLEGSDILTVRERQRLQEYALTFKNQLLSLREISGVEQRGYLKPELQIKINPQKLIAYEVPMAEVAEQVKRQHLRTPLGAMEDKNESEVSLDSDLDAVEPLKSAVIRNTFQQKKILLEDLGSVEEGFEKTIAIRKIQGREAVVFNAQKSSGVGILDAKDAAFDLVDRFRRVHEGSDIRIQILDDESYDVRNRLSIIATNGLVGFLIILVILFLFLEFRAGFWVAMGLPFALAFTLIACMLAGYTVNNITLAAVIIVLGIVVDDAIIVADTIVKRRSAGLSPLDAATEGTYSVIKPVLASILTTCAAFVPLLFFSGRFGMFVKYMPLVVTLMLFASLVESFFVLPAHMVQRPTVNQRRSRWAWVDRADHIRVFYLSRLEGLYSALVGAALRHRGLSLFAFALILAATSAVYMSSMKFVMFPREESKEFAIKVIGPEGVNRYEMAEMTKDIEQLLLDDKFGAVVGFRTVIGESRRGGQVRENEANLRVELLPPSEQPVPFSEMIDFWKSEAKEMPHFQEVRFLESWWSSDSGSPIAIEVQENNDERRKKVSEQLKSELEKLPSLKNVEIERPLVKREYTLKLDREETLRLNINPAQLASTLRAYIEGQILYRLNNGEEEVDVRLTSQKDSKDKIDQVLDLRASNSEQYLVPIRQLVSLQETDKPTNIQRVNYKRASSVYADLAEGNTMTPLEIAAHLEDHVFPKILKESPSTIFRFRGEIEDSRESKSDFALSVGLTLALIYILLVFLFGSLTTPLVIAAAIPFGAVGVVIAFWAHGMTNYGFFAVIGTLGMLGVVINDSIVMVNQLEEEFKDRFEQASFLERIKEISVTRLRPVILTTLTTVAGVFPTAYGVGGYDAMLADMMMAMGWGLIFGTVITLFIVPVLYSFLIHLKWKMRGRTV